AAFQWKWDPDNLLDHIPRDDTPGVVLLLDRDGRFLAGRGESLERVLDPDTAAVGRRIEELFPNAEGANGLIDAHHGASNGELRNCRHRVGDLDVAWELSPVDTTRGREVLGTAIVLDVDHEIDLAPPEPRTTDPVTGLPGRHVIRDHINECFRRDAGRHWAVLRVDVEGVGRINHALGQDVTDVALREAASRIASILEPDERLGRMAGNEFIAFVQCKGKDEALKRFEAMDRLFDEPLKIGRLHFMLRLRVGIALYPEMGSTAGDLERRSAIALERTRQVGANQRFFSERFEAQLLAYSWVPADIKRALQDQEFVLHYQPMIDTESGETVSLEALIRWQHPWRGMIAPGRFIPVVEEMQFMVTLDMWVLDRACHESVEMAKPVSVNITAGTLVAPGFLNALDRVLTSSGLSPERLTLELTERVFSEPQIVLPRMKAVHDRGVKIAVDDFGVGYSSLSYLWQYPVDELKLDGSFLRGAMHDHRARDLVAGLVPLAKTLGMTLVAEGVETAQDHEWLSKAGVSLQQGFFFARPAPLADISTRR
ncbi:MAG: EAL domain-containing protein, partial [Wenzhouxiangellaceae bacterium]|nr:EAL domain-containing protein [Wenzhouxiangellaceae bacterium]